MWFTSILPSQNNAGQTIGLAIMEQVFWKHLSKSRHVGLVHSHSLENRVVVLDFKWQRKVKLNIGSVSRHVAIDSGRLVGIDHNKGQWNLFVRETHFSLRRILVVSLNEVTETNLLSQQIFQGILLLSQLGFSVRNLFAH